METRYSVNPRDVKTYTTQGLRDEFLMQAPFRADQITLWYSHVDRVIAGGAYPVSTELLLVDFLDSEHQLGVTYPLERRELGALNIGGDGYVVVDGVRYDLETISAVYIGKGAKNVTFGSVSKENPAKFYCYSAPAHKELPTRVIHQKDANRVDCGDISTSNERSIFQFIHPDVLETCQISLGATFLGKGSVWNTMPSHTHERRMEVYLYFNVPEGNVVFHLMGEPGETRHIVMQNEEGVISPSWSIHSGVGTSNYAFIWSMAGENRTYTDMDHIRNADLR